MTASRPSSRYTAPVTNRYAPDVRIQLLSTDKVIHEVNKELLIQSRQVDLITPSKRIMTIDSGFFSGLFSTAGPTGPTQDEVPGESGGGAEKESGSGTLTTLAEQRARDEGKLFDIEASSDDLCLFLDAMQALQFESDTLYDVKHISLDTIYRLLPLVDRYDCDGLRNELNDRVNAHSEMDPWGVFELASDLDDIAMAKMAISDMGREHIYEAGSGGCGRPPSDTESGALWDNLNGIRPEWQVAFLRLLSPYADSEDGVRPGAPGPLFQILEIDDLRHNAIWFDPTPYRSFRVSRIDSRKRKRPEKDNE